MLACLPPSLPPCLASSGIPVSQSVSLTARMPQVCAHTCRQRAFAHSALESAVGSTAVSQVAP
eukprot:7496383-Alexandrium_andersonii.AAC.1